MRRSLNGACFLISRIFQNLQSKVEKDHTPRSLVIGLANFFLERELTAG